MNLNDSELVFCENIKTLREKNHLSKRSMAKKLGIGIAALNQLVTGCLPRRLRAGVFLRIEAEFGLSPEQMLSPDITLSTKRQNR